ncbi:MAG: RNB domain-containing ribonuclease [Candidatus Omnitrophota bacterium]|jgi:ribonuclease R|nr:MAG: RNB domain-containing ribonuclease [Candidatus Omnitrophota bacterium]
MCKVIGDKKISAQKTWHARPQVDGVTIDAEQSRDLDDAIHILKQDKDWLLQVSIADVGQGVPIHSREDQDALKKVFTRYYKNNNDPMLPIHLSEDQYSLWEGEDRPVLTVSITLSDQLEVMDTLIEQQRLASRKKLSYSAVDSILKEKDHPLYTLLNECKGIALALLDSRRQKGALALYDLRRGWRTTEEGQLEKIAPEQRHVANIIVQEFMIIANQYVAEYAARKNVSILFRNHTAQAVASERTNLIRDIQNAIADPTHFPIEILQKRMNIVLNRATYGPRIEGHFGLNLPFYTHFTSPIRRYPDLVNHRIISALIGGEEPPYSLPELEEIARRVTTVEHEYKIKRAEQFKRQRDKQILKQAQSGLSDLDVKDFSRLVKMACSTGNLDAALETELLTRIQENQMQPMDYVLILFSISDEFQEDWFNIREQAVVHLTRNPDKAVTILEIAKQIYPTFQSHDCATQSVGESHALIHTSVVKINVNGKPFTSRPCSSSQKKTSQQYATVDLVAQIVDISLSEWRENLVRNEQPATIEKSGTEIPTKNYKGELLETCMKHSWKKPTFNVAQSGPPHAPAFTCVAAMHIDETLYQTEEIAGSNKKDAEQLAAKRLLSLLPQPQKENTIWIPSNIKGGNFSAGLNDFCQKQGWALPEYAITQDDESGRPSFHVTCILKAWNQTITGVATAPNKRKGKIKAAEQVWRQIAERLGCEHHNQSIPSGKT